MSEKYKKILLSLSAATALFIFSVIPAAASTSSNGYQVAPLVNNLTVNRGQSKSMNLYVVNISKTTEYVQTTVDDFAANPNESGQPYIYLNGLSAPSHGLKNYVKISNPKFIIQPNQTATVSVNIAIPSYVQSGGYFAAVRFSPQGTNPAKNVSVNGSVASLFLVTVPGNLKESMVISSFGAADAQGNVHSYFTSSKNLEAIVRFQNTGNVQVQPFGNIILRQGNKDLSNISINSGQGYVLPNSIRYFTVKLNNVKSLGKYNLVGAFGYGNGELLEGNATFYIIPVWSIYLLVIVVLLIIVALIFLIRKLNTRHAKPARRA